MCLPPPSLRLPSLRVVQETEKVVSYAVRYCLVKGMGRGHINVKDIVPTMYKERKLGR